MFKNKTTILLVFVWFVCSIVPGIAFGKNFYVDPSGNDSGPGTEASPFKTPTGCFNKMSGGDTCLIKNGTYSGSGSHRSTPKWNVCDGPNGSSGQPTVYKAAPGHAPKFVGQPVFGAGGSCQYIRIEGLHVDGGFTLWGPGVSNITVTGNEFEGGYDCDGNWAPVRLERVNNIQFERNYVHNLKTNGCSNQGVGSYNLLQMFCVSDSVIERNTIKNDGANVLDKGIYGKDSPINLKIRYNHLIGANIEAANQNNCGQGRNVEIYGNVLEGSEILASVRVDDVNIHHNTLVGGNMLFESNPSDPGWRNSIVRNNLIHNTSQNWRMSANHWSQAGGYNINNNVYDPNGSYRSNAFGSGDTTHSSLASWQSALQGRGCSGCESRSSELICSFTNGSDTNYHLKSGACMTAASDGREVGAYGVTNCVGHLCNVTSEPSSAPMPPENLRVINN
jgi:hypothetical protein